LRFLKARQGSVDKAHAMLLKCIDWRAQQDISRRAPAPMLTQPLRCSTHARLRGWEQNARAAPSLARAQCRARSARLNNAWADAARGRAASLRGR
jgi:hypothetical protein